MATFVVKDTKLYPFFSKHVIDSCFENLDCPHWLVDFQFRTRSKRKDDIVVLGLNPPGNVVYYEHPENCDTDEGIGEDDYDTWHTLVLHSLKLPTSCIIVDANESGFNDLIVTYDYGDSLTNPDVFGGRICWLENYGTNEDDWGFHDIGRFPGVNMIKVGHFTTTFSIQILAIVKSLRPEVNAPLVIFTKPDDVYSSRKWHVNIVLEPEFSAIQDVLIVKSSSSNLDYVVISCQEGLVIAWYAERTWHTRPLLPSPCTRARRIGKIRSLRNKQDPVAYIVAAEADGGVLTICTKTQGTSRTTAFHDITWDQSTLMDFSNGGYNASILDMVCADFDRDGIDEILVSVQSPGSRSGIYYFAWEDGQFVRYKISPNPASQLTPGHFERRNKLDFATLSLSKSREIAVHYTSFVPSQIKSSLENSELVFSLPRLSSTVCEADIIDVAGYVFSLVLLPPDATYQVPTDGVDAVKVLHGSLGWIDNHDRLVERSLASGEPGCATSMLVDCHEGSVRSGNGGAVFIRLRPSRVTDASVLRALNVLSTYFPCDVCEYDFRWESVHDKAWVSKTINSNNVARLQHLNGFRVRFDEDPVDLAYVHFWASEGNVSTGFGNQISTPWMQRGSSGREICSIRACLSNPGGDGGVEYCDDTLDWGSTVPTRHQLSRTRKSILPVLHEQGPLWRARIDEAGEKLIIEYPWHAWVGRGNNTGRWDIWISFDFPPFESPHTQYSDSQNCIIT